mgnify:FL=1
MSFIKQDVLHYDTDVLVIGGGSAGLRAALAARAKGARVLVVNRGGSHSGGSTAYLDKLIEFTGLGVSVGSSESQLYYEELRSYGKEINSDQLLKVFSADDEEELKFLESIGVQFQREGNDYKWIKLPSHTRPRVLRGMEDFGTEILKRMVKACQDAGVEFLTHTQVYRVVKDSQGRPRVALAIRKEAEGQAIQIRFSSIVLATGGFGNLFSYNTNPQGYGSGMAMALDLGARLTNLEFVQILPLLVKPIRGFFIISSLLSQGKVSNTAGELFNPSAPISSANDTVLHAEIVFELCRWIEKQQEQGQVTAENGVYWNGIELKDQMERLIPRSLEVLKARGLDLTREPAVISVGYHQALGGIAIGTSGQTDIPGLFACGECAGGFQGAERMMGTGVMDALVFGRRAGRAAAEAIDGSGPDQGLELEQGTKSGALPIAYEDATRQLQNAMDKILVTKNSTKLQAVKREIDQLKGIVDQVPLESVPLREKVRLAELKDALLIASAYITACEARKESRGSFLRSDYPQEDPEFAAASYIWKEGKDQFQVSFDQ